MGVDDEYKMVSAQEDVNDHLLEQSAPISRSNYRKRNMFASLAVGAVAGAGVMFLLSLIFAPQGYPVNKSADQKQAQVAAPVTVTATATSTVTAPASFATGGTTTGSLIHQEGVDPSHRIGEGIILDCGTSPEEARAKDCVFDVMMQDWTPRPCYDEAISERYLAGGNWTWWADAEASKTLSLDEMRKGEHSVIFVIQDYHKQHCIFAWEKAVRAMRNDWPMIEELISYDHVMHCRHSTLSKEAAGISGVRAPTAYPRCALYKDWQGHFPANSQSSISKREPRPRWELF